MPAAIIAKHIRKSYAGQEIFHDLNLEIEQGKITAIVGPNGAGKSTLFNIIAGLAKKEGGELIRRGFERFRFSYIFQNYRESLLPWKTNLENIAFPLQIQRIPPRERIARAERLLETYGLAHLAKGYPYELSGGEQQIVAFMRAIITRPSVLLLDEPFAALDYQNTLRMRQILQEYYLTSNPTICIITHDIEEAAYVANTIIVLSKKPTEVIKRINNTLPYPRKLETMEHPNFQRITSATLEAFRTSIGV